MSNQAQTIYLKDYKKPSFQIEETHLDVDLHDGYTIVSATLNMVRDIDAKADAPLTLHGAELELLSLKIDDRELGASEFSVDGEELTINTLPNSFTLESVVKIFPEKNTALEGLYQSNGMYCTQCEAEGFRKITYYLDRPDVMAIFTTTLRADKAKYPVLLANGNLVSSGELENDRHFATWEDPFKKPSYLFAMVAGDLQHVEDHFVTQSGRTVTLRIFVEPQDLDKCPHAMESLKRSMRWDEEVYGREYDLDIFMIVAVSHFNMGAMENKGLNIFNTSCVLANPTTTTDLGFQRVESVVAHEYFHNWTGNRVTCREWFQLSLKEGFTVFRDQQFSADQLSAPVQRIEDVAVLKAHQFSEDAGPLSHPVRPESFIEINNFYTATVYEKGAEIVRMIHTVLAKEGFRKGSDLYFERHDGQAVTVEDFVAAMADANGKDLSAFMRWYRQPGTPTLNVESTFNAELQQYRLTFKQSQPQKAGFDAPEPLPIPVRLALLDVNGEELQLHCNGEALGKETVLLLDSSESTFILDGINAQPLPSLLRDFSAPVRLEYQYTDDDLVFLMKNDANGYNRWAAFQELFIRLSLNLAQQYEAGQALALETNAFSALVELLTELVDSDPALAAKLLGMPSVSYLSEFVETVNTQALNQALQFIKTSLAKVGEHFFAAQYDRLAVMTSVYEYNAAAIGQRALKNACLEYLLIADVHKYDAKAFAQFEQAQHMTDEFGALSKLVHTQAPSAQRALNAFYEKWNHEPLVLDQWFAVQATVPSDNALEAVKVLAGHKDFVLTNPNRVRSVIGQFANNNPVGFHGANGESYQWLAQNFKRLDELNPQLASRLLGSFSAWSRLSAERKASAKAALEWLKAEKTSTDLFETVNRLLGAN